MSGSAHSRDDMKKVLDGIRVLDFSRYKAGPYGAMLLGDMGAEVIRVERPGGEDDRTLGPYTSDGQNLYLLFTCRNKKGITLNLEKERGRELLKELVARSDVVIENFGPAANKKLCLDYESLKQVRSDIIAVAVSAYGQYGPYAYRFGFDALAQAMSGIMWLTGFPGGPPVKAGVNVTDFSAGTYAALGTVMALYNRDRTGKGQLVDISLLDTAVSFLESTIAEYEVLGEIRPQVGNANVFVSPYDAYKAKDGYFYVGVGSSAIWKRFLKVTGGKELANDPRFRTHRDRAENRQFFTDWLSNWAADKTVDEIVNQFSEAGVPCAPVNKIPDVAADSHIRAREMIVEFDHPGIGKVPLIGVPVKLSETPGEIRTPAPAIGEHNEEIYCGLLNRSSEELNQLRQDGVV